MLRLASQRSTNTLYKLIAIYPILNIAYLSYLIFCDAIFPRCGLRTIGAASGTSPTAIPLLDLATEPLRAYNKSNSLREGREASQS